MTHTRLAVFVLAGLAPVASGTPGDGPPGEIQMQLTDGRNVHVSPMRR